MSRRIFLPAISWVFILCLGATASAQSIPDGSDAVEQRLKTSLNAMVRDMRATESPVAKRKVLNVFVGKARAAAQVAKLLPFLTEENRAALGVLQDKFGGYSADLRPASEDAPPRVADGELDAYAAYMQQDLEQAAGGGVYLSTGAVIIVLLIILILI